MGRVGGASIAPVLDQIAFHQDQLGAAQPEALQFVEHRREALAVGAVIEIEAQHGDPVLGQGVGQAVAGRHQGAVARIKGVDIAVVAIGVARGPGR